MPKKNHAVHEHADMEIFYAAYLNLHSNCLCCKKEFLPNEIYLVVRNKLGQIIAIYCDRTCQTEIEQVGIFY